MAFDKNQSIKYNWLEACYTHRYRQVAPPLFPLLPPQHISMLTRRRPFQEMLYQGMRWQKLIVQPIHTVREQLNGNFNW